MALTQILIVEDEAVVALDLKLQLQSLGYGVPEPVASGEEAIEAAERQALHLILMDVRLRGEIDGIAAAAAIRARRDIPVIFLTSHSDDDTVRRAAATAPYGYVTKPYQARELRAGIEVALTKVRMERQLREADRWFAHTLQCVADGVIVTDFDGNVRFVNPAAEQLTGWPLERALGQHIGRVVQWRTPDAQATPPPAAQLVAEVLRQGRPAPVVHGLALLSREGPERIVDASAGPVNDDAGQRLGAVLVLRDAAQRLAQEALLRASEERFRNAFDFAPLGMALVSFSGEFIQVNDALCRLLGLPRDELRRRRHAALTLEADRAHEALRLQELSDASVGVVQFEKRYLRAAPAVPVWTLVSVSLLRDGGQASCHLYQVHDLSEQKRAAEHLAALADERMRREASDLANASKSEFLSRVSHEMRTPLNAVMGFAQLLQQQAAADAATARGYAEHIHSAGQHLLALVTDLLDVNRAAQGQLEFKLAPVALAEVVEAALQLLRGEAAAHGVTIDVQVAPALQVLADAQRLRQVLLNIGSNAVKYNRRGGTVQFRAERVGADGIALRVEDGGIGMTPEQLQRLFHPFDRLGAERTTVPGTGLGLVIARSMLIGMGGTLGVQSASRAGTTVTITLRAAA